MHTMPAAKPLIASFCHGWAQDGPITNFTYSWCTLLLEPLCSSLHSAWTIHILRFLGFIDCIACVCRVEDYWLGYKLFCYAYYSHSISHESEFRLSKLGLCIFPFRGAHFFQFFLFWVACGSFTLCPSCIVFESLQIYACAQVVLSGAIMWVSLVLPTMLSAPHAHNCSLLWRCTASGTWRRTAAIFAV